MKKLFFSILLFFYIFEIADGNSISRLVEIACKRNPKLKICGPEKKDEGELPPLPPLLKSNTPRPPSKSNTVLPPSESDFPSKPSRSLTKAEFILLRQLADQTKKVRNPFVDEENVRLDEDLLPPAKGRGWKSTVNNTTKTTPTIVETPSTRLLVSKNTCTNSVRVTKPTVRIKSLRYVLNPQRTPEEIEAEKRLAMLKKARPCTPDCDHRIHKHCTAECKCDYVYPLVQRFCNPPPIPFFLNTCRLWYYGCPKYQQYNYASQFIYSKAEKGKTIAGQAAPRTGDYGGANPYGFRGAGPGGPVGGVGFGSPVAQGELTSPVKPEKAKDLVKNANSNDPFEATREQFLKDHNISPKARQIPQSPVVPTDANFQEGGFHKFDGYTNNNGVLFRPRSRSPFSKPGLWEPNPDDPHNRDHANKWWYHPESVGVDWLSGQLTWGAHWAVPAAGVGGTNGFSAVHFPTIGNFLNIADDYD
ncbi:hypothetical protein FO519_003532 [Halicephalobus sp. NKZ332]|nr:hypothetical protein FO519_003532 [Halicephalobus sp. NKZ332]